MTVMISCVQCALGLGDGGRQWESAWLVSSGLEAAYLRMYHGERTPKA